MKKLVYTLVNKKNLVISSTQDSDVLCLKSFPCLVDAVRSLQRFDKLDETPQIFHRAITQALADYTWSEIIGVCISVHGNVIDTKPIASREAEVKAAAQQEKRRQKLVRAVKTRLHPSTA